MLSNMKKRFEKNAEFRKLYLEFMLDYVNSGHMIGAKTDDIGRVRYFLSHHGVLKDTAGTSRIRTVSNHSAKASNDLSLNDTFYAGANLLHDLYNLILNWMKYPFVFVTDVKQMFRQVRVHSEDQFFQVIFWRFNREHEIKIY